MPSTEQLIIEIQADLTQLRSQISQVISQFQSLGKAGAGSVANLEKTLNGLTGPTKIKTQIQEVEKVGSVVFDKLKGVAMFALQSMTSSFWALNSTAINVLSQIGSAVANLTKSFMVLSGTVAAAAGAAVAFGVNYDANLEQTHISFQTLLKDAKAAQQMVRDLQELAAKSPFDFLELQKTAKMLLAMGYSAKEVIPIMKKLGDTAAGIGIGTEGLQGIALAIAQIKAKGKLFAEEANQLAERGIGVWEALAEKMGKPKAELMKLAAEGKLYADEVLPLIFKKMEEQFGGSLEKQAQTLKGQLNILKNYSEIIAGGMAQPFFNFAKDLLSKVLPAVEKLKNAVQDKGFYQAMKELLPASIVPVYEKTLNVFREMGKALLAIFDLIRGNPDPFVKLFPKEQQEEVKKAIDDIEKGWDKLTSKISSTVSKVSEEIKTNFHLDSIKLNLALMADDASSTFNYIVSLAGIAAAGIELAFQEIVPEISKVFEDLKKPAEGWANLIHIQALTIASGLAGAFQEIMPTASQTFGQIVQLIGSILQAGIPLFGGIISQIANLFIQLLPLITPVLQQILIFIGNIAKGMQDALGPTASIIGSIFSGLMAFITPILSGVLQGLLTIFTQLNQSDAVSKALEKLFGTISNFSGSAEEGLGKFGEKIGQFIVDLAPKLVPILEQAIVLFANIADVLINTILPIASVFAPIFMSMFEIVKPVLLDLVTFIGDILKEINKFLDTHGKEITTVLQIGLAIILSIVSGVMYAVLGIIRVVWPLIKNIIAGAVDVILGVVGFFVDFFSGRWDRLWEDVKRILRGAVEIVLSIFVNLVAFIADFAVKIYNHISSGFSNAWESVKKWVSNIAEKVSTGFWDIINKAKQWGSDVINRFVDGVSAFAHKAWDKIAEMAGNMKKQISWELNNFYNIGKDIVQGIINGLNDMIKKAAEKAQELADAIKNKVKDWLGIRSPSRIMQEFGVNIGQGLIIGMDSMKNMVSKQAASLAEAVMDPMNGLNAKLNVSLEKPNWQEALMDANRSMNLFVQANQEKEMQIELTLKGGLEKLADEVEAKIVQRLNASIGGSL